MAHKSLVIAGIKGIVPFFCRKAALIHAIEGAITFGKDAKEHCLRQVGFSWGTSSYKTWQESVRNRDNLAARKDRCKTSFHILIAMDFLRVIDSQHDFHRAERVLYLSKCKVGLGSSPIKCSSSKTTTQAACLQSQQNSSLPCFLRQGSLWAPCS